VLVGVAPRHRVPLVAGDSRERRFEELASRLAAPLIVEPALELRIARTQARKERAEAEQLIEHLGPVSTAALELATGAARTSRVACRLRADAL
jgi:hypothetical protein